MASDEFFAQNEYDVLERREFWDEPTREIIEKRMSDIPARSFFTIDETAALKRAVARLLPQERVEPIPIVPFIDDKLARNRTDGTRYENMPAMRELWKIFVKALDEEAQLLEDKRFIKLSVASQDIVLSALGDETAKSETWGRLPGRQAFRYITSTIAAFYYAHPYAWNEIEWGGPKYPERYVRIACGLKDPEEADTVGHLRENTGRAGSDI